MHACTAEGSATSTVCRSREKRASSRPLGVVSKKLIGALSSRVSRASCMPEPAVSPMVSTMRERTTTQSAAPSAHAAYPAR